MFTLLNASPTFNLIPFSQEKTNEFLGKVTDTATGAKDKAGDAAQSAKAKTEGAAEAAKEHAVEGKEKTGGLLQQVLFVVM